MKALVIATIAAAATGGAILFRETNSSLATAKGREAFQERRLEESQQWFSRAHEIVPTPLTEFNLGSSRVAAGELEEGAALLTSALADPLLKPDAYYNRGNSALAANAYDRAIADYINALRLRPGDLDAKRNLELSLLRREEQKQQTPQQPASGSKDEQGGQQPQPAPPGEKSSQSSETAEALLRASEQQEREEMKRMRGLRPERRKLGW